MHARSLGHNSLVTTVGALVPMLVSLFTIPPYLHLIGEARYGVLIMIWSLFGLFSLADLGLGRATANQIARAGPGADRRAILWTGALLTLGCGLVGALVLILGGRLIFGHVMAVPPELRREALATLPWLAAAVPVLTTSAVLTGFLEGQERFKRVIALEITGGALAQLLPLVVAARWGPALPGVVAGFVFVRVGVALLLAWACRVPGEGWGRPCFDPARVRGLFAFGGWASLGVWFGPLLFFVDRAVIGALVGVKSLSHYNIPANLIGRIALVPMGFSRALFPRFSALEETSVRMVEREALLLLVGMMTPVIVLALLLLGPFLALWLGPRLAAVTAPVGQVLLVGAWLESMAVVPGVSLSARGYPDRGAKIQLMLAGPYLLALMLGLTLGGVQGAATVAMLRSLAYVTLVTRAAGLARSLALQLVPAASFVLLTAALVQLAPERWRWGPGAVLLLLALARGWGGVPERLRELVPGHRLLGGLGRLA